MIMFNGQIQNNKMGLAGLRVKPRGLTGDTWMSLTSPAIPEKERSDMVIKGIDEDYALDKARIDAEGFDFIHEADESPLCGMCGCIGDEFEKIDGIKVCAKCVKEVYE